MVKNLWQDFKAFAFKGNMLDLAVAVSKTVQFPLALRIPGWCKQAQIAVQDAVVPLTPDDKGFVRISRTWSQGDVVELKLPMEPQLVRGFETPFPIANREYFDFEPAAVFEPRQSPYASVVCGPLLFALPIPDVDPNTPVKDAKAWTTKRRPEILRLFEVEMFGRSHGKLKDTSYEPLSIDRGALGGKAVRKEVAVLFTGKKDGPRMDILIYLPNGASKPVPAFGLARFSRAVNTRPASADRTPMLTKIQKLTHLTLMPDRVAAFRLPPIMKT